MTPAEVLAMLRAKFPRAFGNRPRPLKIGINRDIPDVPADLLATVLRDWPEYLKACRVGEPRINLRGEVEGEVTLAQAAYARMMLRFELSERALAAVRRRA